MKKVIILLTVLLMVGCSKKADMECIETSEFYTTKVELYFDGNNLKNITSISEYNDESLAKQVCATLGDKVKCYKNRIEITDYMNGYIGTNKDDAINVLKGQGLTCKMVK